MTISACAGFEFLIGEEASIFVNGSFLSNDSYENISANIGVRYRFEDNFGF